MKKTHERNALVWLATRPRLMFILLVVLLGLVVMLAGCGGASVTGPGDDPFMDAFRSYANQYAACLGLGDVKVRFDTDSNETPHCGAMPGSTLITCKGPVPFANPTGIASHEVCHLSGLGDEWDAELCSHELLTTCEVSS